MARVRRFEKLIEKLGMPPAAQATMRAQSLASKVMLLENSRRKQQESKVRAV